MDRTTLPGMSVYLHRHIKGSESVFSSGTRAFLQAGEFSLTALKQMDEAVETGGFSWVSHSHESVRLLAPIQDPERLICVGLNYRDHAEEANLPLPRQPALFAKWPNAICGPGDAILRPRECGQLDYGWSLAW